MSRIERRSLWINHANATWGDDAQPLNLYDAPEPNTYAPADRLVLVTVRDLDELERRANVAARAEKQLRAWDDAMRAAVSWGPAGPLEFATIYHYNPRGGQLADDVARWLVLRSSGQNVTALCSFNGTPMLALPGDKAAEVVNRWRSWRGDL